MTSGPWLEVAPIALSDVSIIPEGADVDGRGHHIALWAVSDKGDVLCRLGVSELNPAVSTNLLAFRVVPVFCNIFWISGFFLERQLASGFPRPAQNGTRGREDVICNPNEAGSTKDEVGMESRHLSRPGSGVRVGDRAQVTR